MPFSFYILALITLASAFFAMSLRNLVPGMPAVVARAVTRLMRPVERRGLRGATMTLVLRKAVRG